LSFSEFVEYRGHNAIEFIRYINRRKPQHAKALSFEIGVTRDIMSALISA
jgi:hypothetical protein